MASSAGGADSIGNAPQPQDPEFEGKSNLFATRDKPGAQDKRKIQNTGVPADVARTEIPIVILGKSLELGEKVAAFLRPSYLVIFHATSIDMLFTRLPTLTAPRPQALFLGGGFSAQEQDEAEKRFNDLQLEEHITLIRSQPADKIKAIQDKYASLSLEDAAPRIVKETLDMHEIGQLPAVPAAVSVNAV